MPFHDQKPIKRRRRPTNKAKLKILVQLTQYYEKYGPSMPRCYFDRQMGWCSSQITRWLQCPRLKQVSELPWLKCLKRLRSVIISEKSLFKVEHDELYERFLYKRKALGQEVMSHWFGDEMKLIMSASSNRSKWLKCSNGWLEKFLRRYAISCQIQTEKKGMCNALRVPLLQAFHYELCVIQQGEGLNVRDPVFGRFSALCMWNTDQIPLYFIKSGRRSYNPISDACWVLNQGSSLDKRMATLILTLRAEGEQIVKPFILFHGAGHLSAAFLAELNAYGIPYAFNEKAWANSDSCVDHLRYFHSVVSEKCPEFKEHLLFLDGLSSQSTSRFIELALDLNILPVYFPANCTHLVQPVDHRIAAWFKRQMHELYLVEEQLMHDLWANYRLNKTLNPQYLRRTMLNWTKFCWEALQQKPNFITRSFISTGCLITLKGEHAITFQDIDNYSFEYPTMPL